jgi:hypothetical protein
MSGDVRKNFKLNLGLLVVTTFLNVLILFVRWYSYESVTFGSDYILIEDKWYHLGQVDVGVCKQKVESDVCNKLQGIHTAGI